MSWQEDVFRRLYEAPDDRWLCLGQLFDEFRTQIPPHFAMRYCRDRRNEQAGLPAYDRAQWRYFCHMVREIGIERQGNPKLSKYADHIRLAYVKGQSCEVCHGPVVKTSWKTTLHFACLACLRKPKPQPMPIIRIPIPGFRPKGPNHIVPALRDYRSGRLIYWASVRDLARDLHTYFPGVSINEFVRRYMQQSKDLPKVLDRCRRSAIHFFNWMQSRQT